MFRRSRPEVPGLNTTSTADISFMLLIFFLVTSSMDTRQGLQRQLPPPDNTATQQEMAVKERNVLALALDAADHLTINGEAATMGELTRRVEQFVANANDDPTLPEKSQREVHLLGLVNVSDRHVITIQTDAHTTYAAYFDMQDAIVRAYNNLRSRLAQAAFGLPMERCTPDQLSVLALVYPQRISEAYPVAEEGGEP